MRMMSSLADFWVGKSMFFQGTQVITTVILASTVPLLFVILAKRWLRERSRLPYPPGPKAHWLLGNLKDLPDPSKDTIDTKLLEWSKQYGLYFTIEIPLLGKFIVISDPALFKRVSVTKNRPKSPSYKAFTSLVGKRSMLVLSGPEWARHRKGFNPGFATSFIRNMVPVMAEKLQRLVRCLDQDAKEGVQTVMLPRAQTFTSDVIASLAFGEDWGGGMEIHPARVWLSEMTNVLEGIILKPFQRLLGVVGLGPMRQVYRYEKLLNQEMRAILDRRLAAGVSSENAHDICSLAIKAIQSESHNAELTEEDMSAIVDQLKTFYFAGHDTTATLITWSMWLLGQDRHKEILTKIRSELHDLGIWKDTTKPHPSYEDLQKCSYLEAVLKEVLRLYPPAGVVSRWGDDPEETYEGYQIGGVIQMLAIYTMHHNPALWKNPEEFRPERFLDGSEEGLVDKFVPFSRGPRDCIGKHFAMLEAKLAVSSLVTLYNVECVNPNEQVTARITYVPRQGGLVRFRRR